jgi:hypothetical protein
VQIPIVETNRLYESLLRVKRLLLDCVRREAVEYFGCDTRVSESQRLIRRRSIRRGHRLPVQAQVNSELSAMMHQVIQKHLAIGQEREPSNIVLP